MYFRTSTGSNVAAGVYTDRLTINWNWDYCSGINALGVCLGRDRGSGTTVLTVTLAVTNDCIIGMGSGSNAAVNGRRQMASGASLLQYDLFISGTTVWGTTANRVASAGPADGLTNQSYPYSARVYADQPTPPVGTYTDTVVVDVRY